MNVDEVGIFLEGQGLSDESVDDFLEHFGVKGQRWGVRKNNLAGVSNRTNREARKDAEEFSRAKMFFGEGAGTRRKLIKNTVDAKQKRDSDYAKAFDHHLGRQDMSSHASKARGERSRTDKKQTAKRSAGMVARKFTGEMGTTAAFTAAALAGGAYLTSPSGRRNMNKATAAVKVWANSGRSRRTQDFLTDYFQRNG